MKRLDIALALALATLASTTPARAAAPYAERSDQVVSPAGVGTLELHNARGSVKVRPSADGKLHVTAIKICRLQRAEDVKKYASQTTVESRAEGDRWVVRVTYPKRIESRVSFWEIFSEHGGGLQFPVIEVQLEIEAPAAWNATAESASGDLDVQGLKGRVQLHSTSGDIALADAPGAADVSSVSGDVDLAGVGRVTLRTSSGDASVDGVGALHAETTSGNIEVDGARDTLRIESTSGDLRVGDAPRGVWGKTLSGDVEVSRAAGVVVLSSRSGDVKLGLVSGLVRCDASTTSGELAADLDPGLSASIRLQTTSGSLECAAPVRLQSQDRRHLTAVFGRGGTPVALQTVSGDLNLTSGGH